VDAKAMSTGKSQSDQFARTHGSPGEQPRLRGFLRVTLPLVAVAFAAGYLLRAALPQPPLSVPTVGVLLVVLALLLAVAVRVGANRLASFLKGARGEEAVGHVLGRLPAAYDVLHGLPIADRRAGGAAGDLDHVVVGPSGVFLVETKRWAGAVTISGDQILVSGKSPTRPPLEQLHRAADSLRAFLRTQLGEPVPVMPVLCFVGAAGNGLRSQGLGGALVCDDRHLLDAVQHADADSRLAPERQARIVAALKACLPA
jgi:hypothetical protein